MSEGVSGPFQSVFIGMFESGGSTSFSLNFFNSMRNLKIIFLSVFLLAGMVEAYGQCNTLRPQIDITFNTDQDCAPSSVTEYTIKYYFNVPQDPATIAILFEWNDPGNNTTLVNLFSATPMVVSGGDREFEATATFTYPDNDDCSFSPTAYILINGAICPTSRQVQTAYSWARDNQFGAQLDISPNTWDVCYGDAVVNAVFEDASEFNCNINVEPDNPNRQTRHVQFVYGNLATHNAAATILDLTLNDGGPVTLTDGAGNLVGLQTRGTAGLQITAAHFGPVDNIPFPADGPISVSFPMNAPANPANLIGNQFEITMFNWNICNPYNGDPNNPNYEDAISTTAYIRIVDDPDPLFETHKNSYTGPVPPGREFCIGQEIFLTNGSAGASAYRWEIYDGPTDSDPLLASRTNISTTYTYNTSGNKLIRLYAINGTAQSSCERFYDLIVNITPSRIANITTTDLADNTITPEFCQTAGNSSTFNVRFYDTSTGAVGGNTQWRWAFLDENGVVFRNEPASGYSDVELGPFDQAFVNPGVYRVRLFTRNSVTGCTSRDEVEIKIFPPPVVDFTAGNACEGTEVAFLDMSTLNNPVDGESIQLREWDFNYDGTNFNPDPLYNDSTDFSRILGAPGTYDVALRVTTTGNCSEMTVHPVTVNAVPIANIATGATDGCSPQIVNLQNNSVNGQPDAVDQFIWEVNDGSGYVVDSVQRPTDPGFTDSYQMTLVNNTTADITFQIRQRVRLMNGCETISNVVSVVVFPSPQAAFAVMNYSPFDDNCSPISVDFQVLSATAALGPTSYDWTISDNTGVVYTENTGTNTNFNYVFTNNTQTLKDYVVRLQANFPSGCPADTTTTIRVNPIPSSAFTIDTLEITCNIFRVQMSAVSKGLDRYDWAIRENGLTTFASDMVGDTFEYTFNRNSANKNIEVDLQTVNFANCSSNLTTNTFIVPQSNPVNASFTVSPPETTLPNTTFSITNNSTGNNLTYLWDFGDGTTSTSANPGTHSYPTFGDYQIKLRIEADLGCVDSTTVLVRVNPIPPIVDFAYDPASGCAPLTVQFTNLSQYADPTTYFWDFGDGIGTSRNENPVYTYSQPGLYTVSLSASNVTGDTITETKFEIIEVFNRPIADFTIKSPVLYIPDDIMYIRNDSRFATRFEWDFGDGNTSTEAQPIHRYEEQGFYDITLTAYNDQGCLDIVTLESIVQVKNGGRLLVPNAFSPNLYGPTGGGLGEDPNSNDVFRPKVQGVVEYELMIFNRWGELLFHTTDKNIGWDGYYKGKLSPQDVYIYQIKVVFVNGERITRTGDVNLIR